MALIEVTYEFINDPPELEVIGDKIVDEGQTLIFAISATDADGDVVTYSATSPQAQPSTPSPAPSPGLLMKTRPDRIRCTLRSLTAH